MSSVVNHCPLRLLYDRTGLLQEVAEKRGGKAGELRRPGISSVGPKVRGLAGRRAMPQKWLWLCWYRGTAITESGLQPHICENIEKTGPTHPAHSYKIQSFITRCNTVQSNPIQYLGQTATRPRHVSDIPATYCRHARQFADMWSQTGAPPIWFPNTPAQRLSP